MFHLQDATVLDLKEMVKDKMKSHPETFLQRLSLSPGKVLEEEGDILSSFPWLTTGSTLFIVIQAPFIVHVQEGGKEYIITIPSCKPEVR